VSTVPTPPGSARQLFGDTAPNLVELTEAITHLALYAGWPSAMSAATALRAIVE